MNTGITSVTSSAGPEPASPKPKSESSAAASVSADSTPAPTSSQAPLPVSSSSSASVSDNGNSKDVQAQDARQKPPTLQDVIKLSEKMNKEVQKIQRDLNFSVDDSQGKIVVKVIDRGTKEVIRQIPSEEMLNLSRSIEEVNSLLFDKIKA